MRNNIEFFQRSNCISILTLRYKLLALPTNRQTNRRITCLLLQTSCPVRLHGFLIHSVDYFSFVSIFPVKCSVRASHECLSSTRLPADPRVAPLAFSRIISLLVFIFFCSQFQDLVKFLYKSCETMYEEESGFFSALYLQQYSRYLRASHEC